MQHKHPQQKPLRPRCAYNFFFKQRYNKKARELNGGPKPNYRELTRDIGKQWKKLSPEERSVFEAQAKKDMRRYKLSKIQWEAQHELGLTASVKTTAAAVTTPTLPAVSIYHMNQIRAVPPSVEAPSLSPLRLTSTYFAESSTRRTMPDSMFQGNLSMDNLETEISSVEDQHRMIADRCRLNLLLQRFESAMQRVDPHQLKDDDFPSAASFMSLEPINAGAHNPKVDLGTWTGDQAPTHEPAFDSLTAARML